MFKVVKSRKAKKITTLLALLLVMTSLMGTPMEAYATEVGDVLYEETEDNYVQEDITEDDEEYYYPSDITTPGGSTTGDESKTEETKQEETKQEETKQEETKQEETKQEETKKEEQKQDSVADSLEDLDKDQFIDADTPIGDDSTVGDELDKSETEGNEIPDDVKDEVDVKFPEDPTDPTDPEPTDPEPTDPEPTDPEPTDPEPTDPEQPDVPKMGDDYTRYYVGGAVGAAIIGLLASIKAQLQKHKEAMAVLGTDTTASRVVASKKKYAKKGKKKLM